MMKRLRVFCLLAPLILAGLGGMGCGSVAKPANGSARLRPPVPPVKAAETFEAVWQTIYTTHFDTNFNGVNWVRIKDEYRARATQAKSAAEFRQVLQEMLDLLGHSHLAILPASVAQTVKPEPAEEKGSAKPRRLKKQTDSVPKAVTRPPAAGEGQVGFDIRLENDRMLVTRVEQGSPAAAAGVKPGWIVQALEGEPVRETLDLLRDETSPQKVKVLAWSAVAHQLKGAPDSVARIDFLDAQDKPVSLSLRRAAGTGEAVKLGNLPTFYSHSETENLRSPSGLSVGLIRFNIWMLPAALAFNQAMESFRSMDGVVIDMRGNIGGIGMMVMGVAGHFLNDPVSLGTMKMRDNELRIIANPRKVSVQGRRVDPFGGPVAILIDDISLSAAELFAGGMQSIGRARLFGGTSAGQALPASFDRLPNGDVLYHAIADFVTPDGTRLEGRGVIPDEKVPLRRADLLDGKDAPLLSAIKWIENEAKAAKKGAAKVGESGHASKNL